MANKSTGQGKWQQFVAEAKKTPGQKIRIPGTHYRALVNRLNIMGLQTEHQIASYNPLRVSIVAWYPTPTQETLAKEARLTRLTEQKEQQQIEVAALKDGLRYAEDKLHITEKKMAALEWELYQRSKNE